MPEKLYTVQELQEILKIKAQAVAKLIDSGRLPGINVGFGKHKLRRVTESSLNAFLSQTIAEPPRMTAPHEEVFQPGYKSRLKLRTTVVNVQAPKDES